jgi:hypothetical protein
MSQVLDSAVARSGRAIAIVVEHQDGAGTRTQHARDAEVTFCRDRLRAAGGGMLCPCVDAGDSTTPAVDTMAALPISSG